MLVGHWALNGDTKDYSGYGLDGAVSLGDGSFVTSKFGQGVHVDNNVGIVIDVERLKNKGLVNLNDNSISFWMKSFLDPSITEGGAFTNWIFHYGNYHTDNSGGIGFQSKAFSYYLRGPGAEGWTDYEVGVSDGLSIFNQGGWIHYVVIFRGNDKLEFYMNGVQVFDVSLSGPNTEFTNPIITLARNMDGIVNDVRVYSHALSKREIKELGKALVLHYGMDNPYVEPTVNLCRPNDWSSFTAYTLFDMTQVVEPLSPTGTALRMHLPVSSAGFNGAGRARVRSLNGVDGNTCTVSFVARGKGSSIGKKVRIYIGTWHTSSDVLSEEYKQFVFENVSFTLDEIGFAQDNWVLGDTMYVHSPQIEIKDHATPFVNDSRGNGTLYDLAGYGNKSQLEGGIEYAGDSPINKGALRFNGANTSANIGKVLNLREELTVAAWVKYSGDFTGGVLVKGDAGTWASNSYIFMRSTSGRAYIRVYDEGGGVVQHHLKAIGDNKWHHVAMTFNQFSFVVYLDGEVEYSIAHSLGLINDGENKNLVLGKGHTSSWYTGDVTDLRVYATALSVEDIKELMATRVSFSNQGDVYTHNLDEGKHNILEPINKAIMNKKFENGLERYTQTNTEVTITDNGYRIYRTPNVNPADHGNTMWGGLRINLNNYVLKKGQRYKVFITVNGQSSNGASIKFSNNMGWESGGLKPEPTTNKSVPLPKNFQGSMVLEYDFTINDDVYKVCTESYFTFIEGQIYLSYKHLTFGFAYEDTGSLGTDLYITSVELFNITNDESLFKIGGNGFWLNETNEIDGAKNDARHSICKNGVFYIDGEFSEID